VLSERKTSSRMKATNTAYVTLTKTKIWEREFDITSERDQDQPPLARMEPAGSGATWTGGPNG